MKFLNILIVLSILSFWSCTKKEEKVEIIISGKKNNYIAQSAFNKTIFRNIIY